MGITFEVTLEKLGESPVWVIARVPFNPVEIWPELNKLRIQGSIRAASSTSEAYSFSTSLIRSAKLGYFLLVTGKMRKAARLNTDSRAELVLEPDLDGLAATPPPELAKLLRADRAVRKWYEKLNYSMRKYIADMVAEPKSAEARVRRAEQWMERLMLTMEGEQSPPPILQVAFRRQPLARAGWDAMTANQRKMNLLSIFSCQSPEAQAKRVDRLMTDAMRVAQRTAKARAEIRNSGFEHRIGDEYD
jgi:uncharacterized protein YdeI (YjbR/CyaY-like superfamily)